MTADIMSLLRKTALAIGMLLAMALILFVHPAASDSSGRITLQLWHVSGAEDDESPVPAWFNKSQNRIRVAPVGLPFGEIDQKFLTAVVGDIPPDIFEFFGPVPQWSSREALMALDRFIERDHFDRTAIFPRLWPEMMWEGHTFAIPIGVGNEAFYWNKQHFREAGIDPERPPETWDDLTTYALKLTSYDKDGNIVRAGYLPGYWSPLGFSLFLNWPLQLGAQFLSADERRVIMNTTATVEALNWEAGLFEKLDRDAVIRKKSSFGYGPQHGFLSGQLSMIVHKSTLPQDIHKFAPGLDYGAAPLPIPRGGKRAVIAGSLWIAIPSGSKHPEEAWDYIKYCTQASAQIRAAAEMSRKNIITFFPANIEAANSPVVLSQPNMDVFVKSMDWAYSSTVAPLAHMVFWRSYHDAWERVMRGQETGSVAMRRVQTDVQRMLDEQLAYNEFYRNRLRQPGK
ncbi:MAG: ABC transporter substrate-binding protein [bacterium]